MYKGIDVSIFQGNPDWLKVRTDGVNFAIIKASQGRSVSDQYYMFADSKFKYNIVNAHKNGIACGVYHYLTAQTVDEAYKEADYFISVIEPYRDKITLWAAVDVEEDKYLPRDKKLLTDIVKAFCERVKQKGFRSMIYTNRNYLTNRLIYSALGGIDIWQAHWSSSKPNDVGNMLKIWQYSSKGRVNGIIGDVDMNYGYFTMPIIGEEPNYADLVCEKCGFEPQTREYLDKYQYSADLWRKLWDSMK